MDTECMGGAKRRIRERSPSALALAPQLPLMKNFDGDKVPSGNLTPSDLLNAIFARSTHP